MRPLPVKRPPPNPAPEPTRMPIQRRDAENAEISAEKTKNKLGEKGRRSIDLAFSLLCASLCVLCVSALNSLPPVEQVAP